MRYGTRFRDSASLFGWSFPTGVKWLVLTNVGIYLIYFFGSWLNGAPIFGSFELRPYDVLHGEIWQLATYLFLHSLGSFWHIILNMLMLWMFGAPVEETWGTRRFLQYYFICGVGAGICFVATSYAFGNPYTPVIGASGAIFGLLLAFGMLFPNQTVWMSFLFPIKAKYMVMIFGAIEFLSLFQAQNGVSNFAHLGGMLFGFVYIKTQFGARKRAVRSRPAFNLASWWNEYRMQRARRKFKVYLKKHGSENDPWVN